MLNTCFTFRGQPIKRAITNHAWYAALERAGLQDFRFHDCGILGHHGIGKLAQHAMS